jgi:hypothetical protein
MEQTDPRRRRTSARLAFADHVDYLVSANGHRAAKPEVASVAARQGLLRPPCRILRIVDPLR